MGATSRGAGSVDLRAMSSVAAAARQVATNGTDQQVENAAEILTQDRQRLYQPLAE